MLASCRRAGFRLRGRRRLAAAHIRQHPAALSPFGPSTYPCAMSKETSQETEPLDFEAALGELEALVQRMETGSLTLEESLQAFERGVKLTRQCQTALERAELRVKALLEDGSEAPVPEAGSGDDGG